MEKETLKLSFSVQGEFITKLAKEWLFIEHKPYEQVEELLLSCMMGSDKTELELKKYVQDILLGRAEFIGNSGDGSFRLSYNDKDLNKSNVFTEYAKLAGKFKEMKEQFDVVVNKYNDLVACLEDWNETKSLNVSLIEGDHEENSYVKQLLLDIDKNCNGYTTVYSPITSKTSRYFKSPEEVASDIAIRTGSEMLDSYLKMVKYDKNYGWLDPQGKFYEVEWGDHQSWVYESLHYKIYEEEKDPIPRYCRIDTKIIDLSQYLEEFEKWVKEKNCIGTGIDRAGDFLSSKGWVLIHSPSQGLPVLWKETIMKMTKAQKEFMYTYYTERNATKEANELYQE